MTATATSKDALATALADFDPWRNALRLSDEVAGDEAVVACAKLLEPEQLNQHVDELAAKLDTDQRIAVTSLWSKYYDAAVMTGVLAAMTLRGVGIDASLRCASMVMRDGLPVALYLPNDHQAVLLKQRWPEDCGVPPCIAREADDINELQRFVWNGMFAMHLEPFAQQVADVLDLRPRITWANMGNRCAYLYDVFAGQPQSRSASDEDRHALLGVRRATWRAGANPLHEPVRYQHVPTPTGTVRVQVRKTCCLRDRLPGRSLCSTCPRLSAEQRAQVLTDRGEA